MRFTLLFFLLVLLWSHSKAQAPSIQWSDCLGGSYDDLSYSIQQTTDGGYIFVGTTYSNDGDVSGNHDTTGYTSDCWVVKLDTGGNIQWQKCLGGSEDDLGNSIQQTTDGGYIFVGTTYSNDGDVSGNHDPSGFTGDCWVVKLDTGGNIQWQKCLGGSRNDYGVAIQQIIDDGYIVAGTTYSNDGDVSGNHDTTGATADIWVAKLNDTGSIQWQKCLGGSDNDGASSIRKTTDHGYILAGNTNSNDGDVSGNHGEIDYWVVKLDSSGNLKWQKCLGGSDNDLSYSIQQTNDSGYIVIGLSLSNDGDVSGNFGNGDYWVAKLDTGGNIQWQKCLGGNGYDVGTFIQQTNDGKYMITGYSNSDSGEVTGNHSNEDYWEVRTDTYGNLLWEKCMGGSEPDNPWSTEQTKDGGYIITGSTLSDDYDVHRAVGDTGGFLSSWDCWIVKLAPDTLLGIQQLQKNYEKVIVYPNPTSNQLTINSNHLPITAIQIENVLGQTLMEQNYGAGLQRQIIDVSTLPQGIYFYRVTGSNSEVVTGKFVKE